MSIKLGRNEKCHCGSGQKYKRCCLLKEEATSSYPIKPPTERWTITKESIERGIRRQEEERKKNYYPRPDFPVFTDPPQLIKNWKELKEYFENHPSELYNAEVEEYSGHISTKDDIDKIWLDEHCVTNYYYLSTHTFYDHNHKFSTEVLRRCGFNVTIDNWDKEDE